MDNTLHLVGIAKKARRVEVGEEPVGAAARARQARLIVLARDAADNTCRRAAHFAEAGACPVVQCPYSKEELGGAVGSWEEELGGSWLLGGAADSPGSGMGRGSVTEPVPSPGISV